MMHRLILAAIALGLGAGTAQAQDLLGTHEHWSAWQDSDATGQLCYISSEPQDAQPTNVRRSPIYFLVTHRQGTGERNEVSNILGYPTDDTADATASIDGRSYPLLTDSELEAAFLTLPDQPGFVEAMKAGSELVVKAVSTRGTHTTDTYSLLGVTAALADIDEACPEQ